MSDFLEQLKLRFAESQKRHQVASQRLQAAQQEHLAATQDFASWQNAVRTETIREQQQQQEQSAVPTTGVTPASAPAPAVAPPNTPALPHVTINAAEFNKTDAIRQMLRQHPEGLRPTELWKQLGDQLKYRAYLYSVLKRLRDKSEVFERRGKYFLKVAPKLEAEEKAHADEKGHAVIQ